MLGLTTDPSPHGMNEPPKNQLQRKEYYESSSDSDSDEGLDVVRKHRSKLVSGLSSPFFRNGNDGYFKKDDEESEEEDDLKTIKGRNTASGKEMEALLWQCLCDKPHKLKRYLAKGAIMANRPFFGDPEPRTETSEQTLQESLENSQRWLGYKIHDIQVVEIDLMAVASGYRLSLFRHVDMGKGKVKMYQEDCMVLTSWKQNAGGTWELCSMTCA